MKILLINNCHYRRGGADVVYLETGRLLESKGHETAYFSTHSPRNEPTSYSRYFIDDIDALQVNFLKQLFYMPRKLYSFKAKRNLIRLLDEYGPDLAHIHLYKGGLTAAILPILKKYKIPTVITLHDYSLLCPRNIFVNGIGKICEVCLYHHPINCVIRRCNRRNIFYSTINYIEYEINNKLFKPEKYFNTIICVCKFNYDKHFVKQYLRDRLVHLYNFAADINNIIPNCEKGNYFLYYGRLKKIKGLNTLINAWKELGSQYKLKIVGEGNMFPEIEQVIGKELIQNIDLLGYKSDKELFSLITNASFIIVPSECYENNPMTIIEAYSYGKPVIASDIGGIPEIIIEGKTGFTFTMGDQKELKKVIEHAYSITNEDYRIMSAAVRNFAEQKFLPDNHYENLIMIYKETVANNYGR